MNTQITATEAAEMDNEEFFATMVAMGAEMIEFQVVVVEEDEDDDGWWKDCDVCGAESNGPPCPCSQA